MLICMNTLYKMAGVFLESFQKLLKFSPSVKSKIHLRIATKLRSATQFLKLNNLTQHDAKMH